MTRKSIGFVLLGLMGFALGLYTAESFFRLFQSTVPPVALGSFQVSAAHAGFLTYGVVLGAVLFVVFVLVALVSPWFRAAKKDPATPPAAARIE